MLDLPSLEFREDVGRRVRARREHMEEKALGFGHVCSLEFGRLAGGTGTDLGGKAGQFGDVEAVRVAGDAWLELVKKDEVVLSLGVGVVGVV